MIFFMWRLRLLLPFLGICVALSACAAMQIDSAISKYNAAAPKIRLGDSRKHVQAVLDPTQASLSADERKPPEAFMKDGVRTEIVYYRSQRQADGLTTDDEFTPYVFANDALIGVGWTVLGGPKTQGQAASETNVNVEQTVVH